MHREPKDKLALVSSVRKTLRVSNALGVWRSEALTAGGESGQPYWKGKSNQMDGGKGLKREGKALWGEGMTELKLAGWRGLSFPSEFRLYYVCGLTRLFCFGMKTNIASCLSLGYNGGQTRKTSYLPFLSISTMMCLLEGNGVDEFFS